jgi:hypothetical protein
MFMCLIKVVPGRVLTSVQHRLEKAFQHTCLRGHQTSVDAAKAVKGDPRPHLVWVAASRIHEPIQCFKHACCCCCCCCCCFFCFFCFCCCCWVQGFGFRVSGFGLMFFVFCVAFLSSCRVLRHACRLQRLCTSTSNTMTPPVLAGSPGNLEPEHRCRIIRPQPSPSSSPAGL